MSRKTTITLPLLMLFVFSCSAHAEQSFTLNEILESAVSSHPVVMGKISEQTGAKAELEGTKWLRYPTPSIEVSRLDSGDNSGLIRLDQPLWTGGRITSAIDAATSRYEASGEAVGDIRLQMRLKVISVYVEAIRYKARLKHANTSIEQHQKLLDVIIRRVAQEVSSAADQRLAESRLYQAMNDQIAIGKAFQNTLAQLSQLCGKPVMEVSDMGYEESISLPNKLDDMIQLAINYSPSLKRIRYEEQAADADIGSKRSAYMPQLGLRAESTTGQNHDNRFMILLQAQPGAGLSAISGVESAIAKRDTIRMSRQASERDIRETLVTDWNDWTSSKRQLESSMQSRLRSKEVFESYSRQYVIGRKTWIDVLNAVRESAQSEYVYEDTRSQQIGSYLRICALCGLTNNNEGNKQ